MMQSDGIMKQWEALYKELGLGPECEHVKGSVSTSPTSHCSFLSYNKLEKCLVIPEILSMRRTPMRLGNSIFHRSPFFKGGGKTFKALTSLSQVPPSIRYNMTKSFPLNDGSQIPSLAFGTGTALYGKDAADFVRIAIENNVTHLDGAQMYRNEDTLGAGIKASGKPRSEIYVVSKLSILQPGQTVKESLKGSLDKLGLDYVDLFLIHTPEQGRRENNLSHFWKGMEEVKQAGLAKSIGVSNFKVEDLKVILETAKIVPSVNQVGPDFQFILISCLCWPSNPFHQIEFHPYVYKAAEPIYKFCQEHGIVIESYGGLTPIVRNKDGPLDPILASIRERLEKTRGHPVSTGQVLTKWILAKNAVVVTWVSLPLPWFLLS